MNYKTRYIIPFIYEMKDFSTVLRTIEKAREEKKIKIQRKSFDVDNSDILTSVVNSFNDSDHNMGVVYNIDKNYMSKFLVKVDEYCYYKFQESALYVFRTGVGFLTYEIATHINMAEDLINFNYRFKEACLKSNAIYLKSANKDQTADKSYIIEEKFSSLGRFITYLLESIFGDIKVSFFTQRKAEDSYQPDKALLFNGVIFEENETKDKFYEYIYHLSNGYKDSYVMPESFTDEIKEIFKDTYLYATSSGFGYYVVKNERNHKFYESGFLTNRLEQYFLFYIIVLFQYYSILNYSMKMSNILKSEASKYLTGTSSLDEEDELEAGINLFLAKGIFPTVSTIEHHNVTYKYIFDKFDIQREIDYLRIGFDSLKAISLKHKEEIENLKDNVREDLINISMAILSILVSLSFAGEMPSLLTSMIRVFNSSFEMSALCSNIITLVLFLGVIFIIIYLYVPKVIQYRKNLKKIKSLKR